VFDVEWKIHVSPDTKAILDTFNTFQLELRGPVEMKVSSGVHKGLSLGLMNVKERMKLRS
jgi:hypothetical protein